MDVFPEDIDPYGAIPASQETGPDWARIWRPLAPLVGSLTVNEQMVINAFLDGATADEIGARYPDVSFQEILNKFRNLIEDAAGLKRGSSLSDLWASCSEFGSTMPDLSLPRRGVDLNPAMTQGNTQNGGIDLTPQRMDLKTADSMGDGIRFDIDRAQLQQFQNAPGLMPVIIDIHPLDSLPRFLGVQEVASAAGK